MVVEMTIWLMATETIYQCSFVECNFTMKLLFLDDNHDDSDFYGERATVAKECQTQGWWSAQVNK